MTEESIARYLEALSDGATRTEAIRYTGIGRATFYRWMADERREFRDFRDAVERAEYARDRARTDASLKAEVVWHLFRASRRSVRAALRWLEVNYPQVWGGP